MLLLRQHSSGMRLSRIYWASVPNRTAFPSSTVKSSTRRVPCPIRCAPQYWSACQIDFAPNASPAWMVMLKLLRRQKSNAAWSFFAGLPASSPARSNATAPLSRYATASSAIGIAHWLPRIEQTMRPKRVPVSPSARRRPRRTASITSSCVSPLAVWKNGAKRSSA